MQTPIGVLAAVSFDALALASRKSRCGDLEIGREARIGLPHIDLRPRRREVRPMIRGIFLLLFCQLVGEVLARWLALPAPGPVIGLGMLTIGLWLWNRRRPFSDAALLDSDVGRAATALLGSLSLMFVPAGVGVVQYLGLIGEQGVALAAALIVSTVLTLLATVGVFLLVKRALTKVAGAT